MRLSPVDKPARLAAKLRAGQVAKMAGPVPERYRAGRAGMRILGVDPGLKATGYGLIDVERNQIALKEAGSIEPKSRDALENRIDCVYRNLDVLLQQYHPDVMVLEKLYTHYKHPTTACLLGHIRGVICLLCAQRRIQLKEYPVKRIRKALTGNGNASKLQTCQMVAHLLKIDGSQLGLDASDALALALGYVSILKSRAGQLYETAALPTQRIKDFSRSAGGARGVTIHDRPNPG